MTTIHVKAPYAPEQILPIHQVNSMLASGQLPINSLGWMPGMLEWMPITQVSGIEPIAPPPLPLVTECETQTGENAVLSTTPKRKIPLKAVFSFVLIGLGALLTFSGSGIGLIMFIAGIILGFFASRQMKSNKEQSKGRGIMTAARWIVGLFCLLFLISLVVAIVSKEPQQRRESVPSMSVTQDDSRVPSQSLPNTKKSDAVVDAPTLNKKVLGRDRDYFFRVPANWNVPKPQPPFDSLASSSGVLAGVVVEPTTYEDISDVYREFLFKADQKKAYDISEPQTVNNAGKSWMTFSFKTNTKGQEQFWQSFFTSDGTGTIRFAFRTSNLPSQPDIDTFSAIFKSFTFEKN